MITILFLLISVAGAFATYELNRKLDPIRSACIVTLIGILLLNIICSYFSINTNPFFFCLYGASFLGMSDDKKISRSNLFFAAIIFALVFIFIAPFLKGLGGTLGFLAFLSLLKVIVYKSTIKDVKTS